jgi:hypothetical protein
MAGVVEIGDDRERQPEAVGQPFDGRPAPRRQQIDQGLRVLALGLALDVGGEKAGVSSIPAARWNRVPAAGISPADSAVDPDGTASASTTSTSPPAP